MFIVPRESRPRWPWLALLLAVLPAPVTSSTTDYRGRLCNATISHANATGTASFDPHFVTAQLANGSFDATAGRPLPDPSWLVTVSEDGDEPITELWLDTAGQDYWKDAQTQFDACAFIIRGTFPYATMKRAQDDPGDCTSMLSEPCRQALKTLSDLHAGEILSASKPLTNRSSAISDICTKIAHSLANDASAGHYFPQACSKDFGYGSEDSKYGSFMEGPTNTALALTGRFANETLLDTSCPISGPSGERYYNLAGFGKPFNYDTATRIVTPILTVFFSSPNAHPAAQAYRAPTQLSCLRITDFTTGSVVSPPLSSSYPGGPPNSGFSHRLSGGGLSLAAVLALSLSCVFLMGFLIAFAEFHKWWRTNWRRIEIVDERIQTGYRIERYRSRPLWPAKAKDSEEIELEDLRKTRQSIEPKRLEPIQDIEPREVDGAQILELPSAPGPFELDATERRPSFLSSRRSLQSFDTCESIAVSDMGEGDRDGMGETRGTSVSAEENPVSPIDDVGESETWRRLSITPNAANVDGNGDGGGGGRGGHGPVSPVDRL